MLRGFKHEKKCNLRTRPQEEVSKIKFSYNVSTKTYVVGTQKNGFSEMVLLSTQKFCDKKMFANLCSKCLFICPFD